MPPAKTDLTPGDKTLPDKTPDTDKTTSDTEATEATEPRKVEYYCPGCGRRWPFLTECRGMTTAAPHPPIVVVDTAELDGDPENFTPAPPSLGE